MHQCTVRSPWVVRLKWCGNTWPNIAKAKSCTQFSHFRVLIALINLKSGGYFSAFPQVGSSPHYFPAISSPPPACPLRKPRAQTITPALVINRSLNSRPSLALGRKAHSIPGFTSATRIGFSFRSHCIKGFSNGTSTQGDTSALALRLFWMFLSGGILCRPPYVKIGGAHPKIIKQKWIRGGCS